MDPITDMEARQIFNWPHLILTKYQLHILHELRQLMDNRLPAAELEPPTEDVIALSDLKLIELVHIEAPEHRRVRLSVRLTPSGYYLISIAFLVQRLIEYIDPTPTLGTQVRHRVDPKLTGRVIHVWPSGKLRVRWDDSHPVFAGSENDQHIEYIERYR